MSGLIRTRALAFARASALAPASAARAFSTTAAARGFAKEPDWDQRNEKDTDRYMWDEASTVGYIRLAAIDDVRQLVANMYTDTEALNAQARPFTPAAGQIRLTTAIDLANPNHEYNQKTVLSAPLSALPLNGAEAVRRFQLLAGPRWTPGEPGSRELTADGDGWFKLSEARYPASRMNRKSASDMLERLVEAANVSGLGHGEREDGGGNGKTRRKTRRKRSQKEGEKEKKGSHQDPKSPIPADAPVDSRHLVAKQRKWGSAKRYARREALERRPEVVGGVKGFPKEWLSPEAQDKLKA